MHASKRIRTFQRHEWPLTSPAHHTEIAKAVAVAVREAQDLPGADVHISSHDEEVIIWYETEPTATAAAAKRAADRG